MIHLLKRNRAGRPKKMLSLISFLIVLYAVELIIADCVDRYFTGAD